MNTKNDKIDFSETLFLPKTSFAMRAGLPEQEPKILDGWSKDNIYEKFLTIVEWPERLGEKIPDSFLQIEFIDCQKNYEQRNLKISLVGINRNDIRSFLKHLKNDIDYALL